MAFTRKLSAMVSAGDFLAAAAGDCLLVPDPWPENRLPPWTIRVKDFFKALPPGVWVEVHADLPLYPGLPPLLGSSQVPTRARLDSSLGS